MTHCFFQNGPGLLNLELSVQDVYATQINESAAIRLAIDRTTQCGTSSVEKKIYNTLILRVLPQRDDPRWSGLDPCLDRVRP